MTRDTRETIADAAFIIIALVVFVVLAWWIA